MFNDKQPTFCDVLDEEKPVSIYSHYLQTLALKMFKVTKGIAQDILANIFNTRKNQFPYTVTISKHWHLKCSR